MKQRFGMALPHTETSTAYLTFSANDRIYAVKASCVLEIAEITSITSLPRTAPYILGVTKVRDTVYSVLDLQRKLGLEHPTISNLVVAILLSCKGSQMCMVVDKVIAVTDIDDAEANAPLGDNPCVIGVVQVQNVSVALLSISKLFDIAE